MSALILENLSYRYPGSKRFALSGINLQVEEGEAVGVIGLNGSGKTTLSYCLCGIIPHYYRGEMTGTVKIMGEESRAIPLHQVSAKCGIVLQDPSVQLLMPTVEDDIAFALENACMPPLRIKETVERALRITGIEALRAENPNLLSGGEKQLAALATVLALDPSIIIFDEALSMLDEEATDRIVSVMLELKNKGTSMVVIDHTGKGEKVYDRVAVLEAGELIRAGSKHDILADAAFMKKHSLSVPVGPGE